MFGISISNRLCTFPMPLFESKCGGKNKIVGFEIIFMCFPKFYVLARTTWFQQQSINCIGRSISKSICTLTMPLHGSRMGFLVWKGFFHYFVTHKYDSLIYHYTIDSITSLRHSVYFSTIAHVWFVLRYTFCYKAFIMPRPFIVTSHTSGERNVTML